MSDWLTKIPAAARQYIDGRRLDEIECIVPDIAGVARGKAMPASKFARQESFYLPNSIFLQTITGEWADNPTGAFTEPDMVLTPDYETTSAAPWTASRARAADISSCMRARRGSRASHPRRTARFRHCVTTWCSGSRRTFRNSR